jgi:hypothetical protein
VLGAIPLAGQAAIEVFNALIVPPMEMRRNEWMTSVVLAIKELQSKESNLLERLQNDEAFQSVLLQASWAAMRNHQIEKLTALRYAVQNAAIASSDAQLLFVRYVDELTPTHLIVMSFFAAHQNEVAGISTFANLHGSFFKASGTEVDQMFFKLVCEDLDQRGLIRISSHLEDFPGLYDVTNLITEDSCDLPYSLVSELGQKFVDFVLRSPLDGAP